MTKEEKELVLDVIHIEGFDYTFYGYSDFSEIKDKKFHRLRKEFLKARELLREYVYDEGNNENKC